MLGITKEAFKRHADHSFTFCPKHLDFEYFAMCLNNLHVAIIYTFEKTKLNPFATLPSIEIFGY